MAQNTPDGEIFLLRLEEDDLQLCCRYESEDQVERLFQQDKDNGFCCTRYLYLSVDWNKRTLLLTETVEA